MTRIVRAPQVTRFPVTVDGETVQVSMTANGWFSAYGYDRETFDELWTAIASGAIMAPRRQAAAAIEAKLSIIPAPALTLTFEPLTVRGVHAGNGDLLITNKDGARRRLEPGRVLRQLTEEELRQGSALRTALAAASVENKRVKELFAVNSSVVCDLVDLGDMTRGKLTSTFDVNAGMFRAVFDGRTFEAPSLRLLDDAVARNVISRTHPFFSQNGFGDPDEPPEIARVVDAPGGVPWVVFTSEEGLLACHKAECAARLASKTWLQFVRDYGFNPSVLYAQQPEEIA